MSMREKKRLKVFIVLLCIFIGATVCLSIWKNRNRKPEEYTFQEYDNMNQEERLEFQDSFDSFEDFDAWLREQDLD